MNTCLLLLAFVISSNVKASDNSIFLPVSDFVESLQPTRPVSGDLIASFSGLGKGSVKPARFEAWVPAEWKNQPVCAMIRSRDGRYEAYQSFNVPLLWTPDFQLFEFNELEKYEFLEEHESQLAASLHLGHCGSEQAETTLVYWGGRANSDKDNYRVYLNSMRAQEASLYFYADDKELTCEAIQASDRQVFDFSCDIGIVNGAHKVEINRIRRGNYDDAVDYVIYSPEPSS